MKGVPSGKRCDSSGTTNSAGNVMSLEYFNMIRQDVCWMPSG